MLDLETQLAGYGTILEEAADAAELVVVHREPRVIDLAVRRPRRGPLVAAAVVLLVAVAAGAFLVLQSTGSSTDRSFAATGKSDYTSFRKYMDLVFAYAGTYRLDRELRPVVSETRLRHEAADIAIGDVFIKGGFPGHAVLVADMAADPATSEKRFLLLQSYMPAQDIHVLKNPADGACSPW